MYLQCMMRLALTSTRSYLRCRFSSLQCRASEISSSDHFTECQQKTHLNINCSKETVWIRPSWLKCCEEKSQLRTTKKKRRIACLVSWFQIWHFSVFVRCREGEQMGSTCVVPTMKHKGGAIYAKDFSMHLLLYDFRQSVPSCNWHNHES